MSTLFHQLHADPWSTTLGDVEALNARASDAVLAAIDAVRGAPLGDAAARQSRSFLIVGPAGAGKTHLFARLRRRAGSRAAFVLLRPELAVDPTPRLVLAHAIDALRRPVPGHDLTQLDVAVGSALSILERGHARWPALALDGLREAGEEERRATVERVVDLFERNHPEVDLDWLGRFLALPFAGPTDRRAGLHWLSGREPDAHQLERLGLRERLPDSSVMPALRTLGVVASLGAPLVIVYDQLENLVEDGGATGRIHAHARLYAELHDTVPGLVLVQMALDTEWEARISPALGAAERSRLEARVLTLDLPDGAGRTALLELWLAAQGDGHSPPWPFSAAGWARWRSAPGVTPRRLMIAAREALEGDEEDRADDRDAAPERLEALWQEQLALARSAIDDAEVAGRPLDREHVQSGVAATLALLGVEFAVGGARDPHQLRAGGATLHVVQEAHPRSVIARLERAREAAATGRVVVVRQASRPIPPTWKRALAAQAALVAAPGASWLDLGRDEVARLMALHDLLAAARSHDLAGKDGRPIPEDAVRQWARGELGAAGWPAIEALVSAGRAGAALASSSPPSSPPPSGEPVPIAVPVSSPVPLAWDAERTAPSAAPAFESRAPVRSVAPAAPAVAGTPPVQGAAPAGPAPASTMPVRSAAAAEAVAPAPEGAVAAAVVRLRLASVDRILREARAAEPGLTLGAAVDQLRALGPRLMWFGRSIVWWEDGS